MSQAYLFEAKGIQRWLLEGGKLRDIAAGSALLSSMARSDENDILRSVLVTAGFVAVSSRRAGGAFMLHFGDDEAEMAAFRRFRTLWRLTFMRLAPGLEFSEALGSGNDIAQARAVAYAPAARLSAARENSAASVLPPGHPLTRLAGRTGRPAAASSGAHDPDGEGLDLMILARRRAGAAVATGKVPGLTDPAVLALEADFDRSQSPLKWPNQMESSGGSGGVTFPFETDDTRIAVMHADISALGQFYERVGKAATGEQAVQISAAAAAAIEVSVARAAAQAAKAWLVPGKDGVMHARPVLIGGDDITMILRADGALDFTSHFLQALEETSRAALEALCDEHRALDRKVFATALTAAAGVAIGGAKQPFFRLLDLADSLCSYAKGRSKAAAAGATPRSVLAFQRVTETALASSADDLFERLEVPGKPWRLTAQPYRTGNAGVGDFPELSDLRALLGALDHEGLKPGRLRDIRGSLLQSGKMEIARQDWRRWREMAAKRDGVALTGFDDAHAKLFGTVGAAEQLDALFAQGATPLFDALEWRALQ